MGNPADQNASGQARKHRTQLAVVTSVNAGNLGHQADHIKQTVSDNSSKQRNLNNVIKQSSHKCTQLLIQSVCCFYVMLIKRFLNIMGSLYMRAIVNHGLEV
jgi:hypothetical protein